MKESFGLICSCLERIDNIYQSHVHTLNSDLPHSISIRFIPPQRSCHHYTLIRVTSPSASTMFGKLSTKIALRKAGLPSNTLSSFSITNLDNGDKKSINMKSGKSNDPPATWADTFSNMTSEVNVPKSWKSWGNPAPAVAEVATAPVVGSKAPSTGKLILPMGDRRACVLVFLRCCGCACEFVCFTRVLLLRYFIRKTRVESRLTDFLFSFSCRKDLHRTPSLSQ